MFVFETAGSGWAQTGRGIPIIVMGEDSDLKSVKRDSDVFQRVLSELKRQISIDDYYVIDEEMMATDLGWVVRNRRPKEELIEVADLAAKSDNSAYHARAIITFKIRAMTKDTGFGTIAFVRISGEIYDIAARRFIDSYELPPLKFTVRTELTEALGEKAREVAEQLGRTLAEKLTAVSGGTDIVASSNVTTNADTGLVVTYTFTFKQFSTREVLALTDVMESEFAGFIRAASPSGDAGAVVKYGYTTTAGDGELYRWINLLLIDKGLPPDSQVKVIKNGTSFQISKLYDTPASDGETSKCRYC
jgi:hypothetical protein